MADITIHNVDDDLMHRLCIRAVEHSRTLEEEAREILRTALGVDARRGRRRSS